MRVRKLESFDDFNRALKNKYGVGEFKNYKPWHRVQDVKSEGVRSQIIGLKSNRTHHLMSGIETEFFYIADFSDSIVDIREQFPLIPINLSLRIAKFVGIKHPPLNSKNPIVMTTDFVLTRHLNDQQVYEAIAVKPLKELEDQRVLEKLEIERIWWELLGVKFDIYTGTDETRIHSENIKWATQGVRSALASFDNDLLARALDYVTIGKSSIKYLCDSIASNLDIKPEQSLEMVRYMIGAKYIEVDLTIDITHADIINVTAKKQINNADIAINS